MGTGNKLDPTRLEVSDIYRTSVCPLAKVMRRELKKRGVQKLKVVYSTEEALTPIAGIVCDEAVNELEKNSETEEKQTRRATPGSNAFVPATAGLLIGSEVVKDLMKG